MNKIVLGVIIAAVTVVVIIFIAKNQNTPPLEQGKLQVATSFYPLYFFAKEIGGDRVQVINITPSGAEPHDYDLTTQDRRVIERSSMLVLTGGLLEPWGEKVTKSLTARTLVVNAVDGITGLNHSEYNKTRSDPHVWLDPQRATIMARTILQGYIQTDPQNAGYYRMNEKQLEQKLSDLDIMFERSIKNCAYREFVTTHAAFGYLAERYGLTQLSIAGISPDEEPSIQKIVEIQKLVKNKNIEYIFFERLVSPKYAQTVSKDTGAKLSVLDPLEGLTREALNTGKDYFTIMNENLLSLKKALRCQ
jgi:zinc transport system substrate-binding protein